MIRHAAEVWATLAVCFVFGALFGSIVQRTVALTALRQGQARLIRSIDRAVLWLERNLVPRRGTVPTVLPRTVPVPPPDFGHGVVADESMSLETSEPFAPHLIDETSALHPVAPSTGQLSGNVRAAEPSPRHAEAVARGDTVGVRPLPLNAPRQGGPDPLTLIRGVTKRHAAKMAQVGIFHFSQIASWTPQEVAWVSGYLGVGDALTSKDWVGQAILFASADEPVRLPEPSLEAGGVATRKKRQPKKTVAAQDSVGSEPLRRKPTKRKAKVKASDDRQQEDRPAELAIAERSDNGDSQT
jgi:predicted flap endonuclease-1-like 5' DNA nuclease